MARQDSGFKRKEAVLGQTEGITLTCAQLRRLVDMCTSDVHKKEVLYERYEQLVDKERFSEDLLNGLMHSIKFRSHKSPRLIQQVETQQAILGGA